MKKILLTCLMLAFFSGIANAADETEERYTKPVESTDESVTPGWSGSAGAGLLLTPGNSENTNLNVDIESKLEQERFRHNFIASALQTEAADEKTADKYLLGYKLDYKLTPISYIFSALRLEVDKFSGFDRQTSLTAGYGRRLITTSKDSLDVEVGAGLRENRFESGDKDTEAVIRGAADYHHYFTETTEFHQGLLIMAGEDNTSIDTLSAIRANIAGNLALEAALRLKHNSEPPSGNDKTDTATTVSLVYGF